MAFTEDQVVSLLDTYNIQIGVLALVLFALAYKISTTYIFAKQHSPPGPWGVPIIGHLHMLVGSPNITFMKIRKEFGDVFKIRMGNWETVIVNGKEAIREVLIKKGEDFVGRPRFEASKLISNGENFAFGEYDELYNLHRKLANQLLFDLCSPRKSSIQNMVHEEVDFLVNDFLSHSGNSFIANKPIYRSVLCVMYQICYGYQENIRDNANFSEFLQRSKDVSKFVRTGNPVNVIPWFQYIMPWKMRKFALTVKRNIAFRNQMVEEHRLTHSKDQLRDLTDGLLTVQENGTPLSEKRLFSTIDSIFAAGFSTVRSAIQWFVLLMADNPQVQERVQKELDEVVGNCRRPTVQDREKLVYTEAVLHEVNRFVALSPLGLPHYTIKDTRLFGYRIKKDTVVIANLYSLSHDKDVWGDPDVFRPERFLDESGSINKALLEEFLPFSAGRRKCLGESLAKTQMFLYTAGLVQKCSFLKPPDVKKYNLEPDFGLTQTCEPYMVQVLARN